MGREGRELHLSGARHSTSVWLGKVTSGSEEEDNIIGPMPAKGPVESDVTKEFERRAQRMKEKLASADSPVPRQSWMTELPPGLKSVGFGPRTVRRGADDKLGIGSIWTDTPADRERKAKVTDSEKEDHHYLWIMKELCYLEETRPAEQVTPYNESKRSESLLDVHQKKLNSKASEEQTSGEKAV